MGSLSFTEWVFLFALVGLCLVVLQGYIQHKQEKAQKEHDGAEVSGVSVSRGPMSMEALAVTQAAKRVIELTEKEPWDREAFASLYRCAEQIFDGIKDAEKAVKFIPTRQDPSSDAPTGTETGRERGPSDTDPKTGFPTGSL